MIRRRVMALGEQLAYLRLKWPDFKSEIRGGQLIAIGNLRPSPLSLDYTVRVSQQGGRNPEVRVLSPRLQPNRDGVNMPHMYSQERLCLFFPGNCEWKPDDPISHTVIPWTSLWLYFYEVWHATGEWRGGGIHPGTAITIRRGAYE